MLVLPMFPIIFFLGRLSCSWLPAWPRLESSRTKSENLLETVHSLVDSLRKPYCLRHSRLYS